jgi:hypothetical protein
VGDDSAGTGVEQRRLKLRFPRPRVVPDPYDVSADAHERAATHPVLYGTGCDPALAQLPAGDDPVLNRSQLLNNKFHFSVIHSIFHSMWITTTDLGVVTAAIATSTTPRTVGSQGEARVGDTQVP